MKSTLCALAVIAVVVGFVEAKPGGLPDVKDRGDRVALIDMAHIFKNYREFTDRREALKVDIDKSDEKSKAMVAEIQATQLQLKEAKAGSKEQADLRNTVIELTSKYQLYRAKMQQDFLQQEATIYKEVYLKVQETATRYSKKHRIPLVLRFNRSGVADAKESKAILESMNRLVIHYESGQDITLPVLGELNRRYREKL